MLKYQFKQLIIGLSSVEDGFYHVLEWNKEIDNKYLDELKSVWRQIGKVVRIQEDLEEMKEKYCWLANEWST